ncbi:MAG: site-specific integrase [Rikenellaceae bacterium]
MATIKAKLRASTIEGKEGVIFYQIIHGREIRQLKTDYTIYPHEWDHKDGFAIINGTTYGRAKQLRLLNDMIASDTRRFFQLVKSLDTNGGVQSCDDLILEYKRQFQIGSLFSFFRDQIDRLRELGRMGTACNYSAAFSSFFKFRDGLDLPLDDLNSGLIEDYEAYLRNEKVTMNSSSFYMRILRAVYNKAVECGVVNQHFPFRHVYTGVEKTAKRALSIRDIKRIKECDLETNSSRSYARDLFMFSFYTRGMSFVDMAYLRKRDVKNGVLSYRRRKTGQLLHIKWERCMQEIVSRYSVEDSIYLLPILHCPDSQVSEFKRYKRELYRVNNLLKRLAVSIDLSMPLTMYVARHSWASVARMQKIPISVISEGMGHDSETTTQIYLASIATSVVDKANNKILRLF